MAETTNNKNIITAIKIVGNKEIKDEEILDKINTKVGDEISNQKLQEDMKSVFDLGYFFDIQVSFKNHEDGVMLIFEVIENPKLSQINISGNHEVSTEELRGIIGIRTGQLLNLNELEKAKQEIEKYYREKGYILAKVVDLTIKEKDQLHITINEGRLNNIIINTDGKTKDYVIRRELSIEEGQVFNIDQVWKDLRKIYNLGFFEEVKPDYKAVDGDRQAVDLVINLKEGKTGTFSIGGGYSSASGLTGLIDLEQDNLFGRGQSVKLNWEFGGKKNTYEVGFYQPWVFGTKNSLNFNLYNTVREDKNDNDVKEKGGSITLGRPIAEDTKAYLKYNYQDSEYKEKIEGADTNTQKYKDVDENTRSLTFKAIRDTRDNFLAPKNGDRQEVSIERAGGILGGDADFTKYYTDIRKYIPSGEDNNWAFRLKLGGSNGDLPETRDFYLRETLLDGVRGYDYDYYKDQEGFEGDSLFLTNLEYRIGIVESITGVIFADAGRTFEDNQFSLNDIKYSTGLGIRFNTPIGQLGLDYGYAPEGDDGNKSSFSFRIGSIF
jgi:outer membrane protein insertion porin family